MSRLSADFWASPFAHRGLHDDTRPENSLSAIDAAVQAGYAIEIDVQPSSDGEAMVFHDYTLDRLTAETGQTEARTADELGGIRLNDSNDSIPTLTDVLALVRGRVPMLIEIKDQSGSFVKTDGALERRVCEIVRDAGQIEACAIMSFNPFSPKHIAAYLPQVARGVVSYDFEHPHDAAIDAGQRADLAGLRWFEETECDFVSYGASSLSAQRLAELRASGVPVFCWTIRSPEQAETALKNCDQITFEGYRP